MKHYGQWADGFADRLIPDSTRIETWTAHSNSQERKAMFDYGDEDHDTNTSVFPIIDYGSDGQWVMGLMEPKTRRMVRVLDEDTDIDTLVERAVKFHKIDLRNLWVSPCGAVLAKLFHEEGMKI